MKLSKRNLSNECLLLITVHVINQVTVAEVYTVNSSMIMT